MGREKVKWFSVPGSRTSSIPLKNPGRERRQEAQKDSQEQGTVVVGRGRRYKMGKWWIRGLETRVGRECCISRGGPDCTIEVYMSEESEESHSVMAGGGSSKVRAAKSFEFGEEKL